MATSDLHGHLRGYDYFTGQASSGLGLTRVATLIAQARQARANTLLFDCGDLIQGTPLADVTVNPALWFAPNPMVDALNALGTDAATIGNHEFNFGLDTLNTAYTTAAFPVVNANVLHLKPTDGQETLLPPRVMLKRDVQDHEGQRHQLNIGVTGALPPQTQNWDQKHFDGTLRVDGIVRRLRPEVDALRNEGADLVVVLCHAGIGPDSDDPQLEHPTVAVARIPGVDVVLAGHAHLRFPGPDYPETDSVDPMRGIIHGKPVVMPGAWGSHLGVVDLTLQSDSDAGWSVQDQNAALWPVASETGTEEDPSLIAQTEAVHQTTLRYTARPVGTTTTRVHTFFSMVRPGKSEALVAQAQLHYGRALLVDSPYADLPILSATAPYKCGGRSGPKHFTDIPEGDLSVQHMADIYIFPNSLRALLVDGSVLRDWLDRSACAFQTIKRGVRGQALLDPTFAAYDFDTLFGLSYEIDLSVLPKFDPATGRRLRRKRSRIRDLMYQGQPVQSTDKFIVMTNNYRSGGGGNFSGLSQCTSVAESQWSVRDLLTRYVEEVGSEVTLSADWRFSRIKGASAVLTTSPKARGLAAEAEALGLTDLGDGPDGFAQFGLDLDIA